MKEPWIWHGSEIDCKGQPSIYRKVLKARFANNKIIKWLNFFLKLHRTHHDTKLFILFYFFLSKIYQKYGFRYSKTVSISENLIFHKDNLLNVKFDLMCMPLYDIIKVKSHAKKNYQSVCPDV